MLAATGFGDADCVGVATGVTTAVGDGATVPLEQPTTASMTAASPHATEQEARCFMLDSSQR
jgi:hypothetical protein